MALCARARRASSLAFIVAFLVVLHDGNVGGQICRSKQKYRLKIQMNWNRASDNGYRAGMSLGYVIVVAHTKDYLLFQQETKLAGTVKSVVQKNLAGPLVAFYKKQRSISGQVYDWDYVKKAGPADIIRLNIEVDGYRQATHFSFLGVMRETPDNFFGFQARDLCNQGNFTKRLTDKVLVYDGGFDDRTSTDRQDTPIYVDKAVRSRTDISFTTPLASFSIEQGEFKNVFPFWKILVIVGVLAIVVLVAFICLYPYCCKKQMLDVPVPLQDEAQWAT